VDQLLEYLLLANIFAGNRVRILNLLHSRQMTEHFHNDRDQCAAEEIEQKRMFHPVIHNTWLLLLPPLLLNIVIEIGPPLLQFIGFILVI
jgi:hypothetical protein